MSISARRSKAAHELVTLLASAAQTTTNTGASAVRLPPDIRAIAFTLNVTAAATTSGDTLDVFIQTLIDGTSWVDIVRFTLVLGDGGTKKYVAKISADAAMTMFENATGLGAGAVRNLLGDEYRVRFVVVDETTDDASFTFSVAAIPM